MRFIHTADWHLGRLFHGVHLTEDQAYLLDQFVDLVKSSKPDLVIVAGDIYDRAIPPPPAVELLNDTVSRVVLSLKTPMLLIAGNHDSPERLGFGADLFSQQNLHIFSQVGAPSTPLQLEDKHGKVNVHALPYAEPAVVRQELDLEDVKDHDAAMKALLDRVRGTKADAERSVLVAHAFVTGGKVSESERPLSVGGTGQVTKGRFSGFDYVALGHLHRPQSVGNSARYAGSLMKYSFSEAKHQKSVSIVEMDGKGKCSVEEVSLTPKRDVRKIRGHMKAILEKRPGVKTRDDYLMVTLLDKGAILDAMGKLREVYPNVLHIERPKLVQSDAPAGRGIDHRRMSDEELFSAFFEQVTGEEPTPGQLRAYSETVEEVRQQEREA